MPALNIIVKCFYVKVIIKVVTFWLQTRKTKSIDALMKKKKISLRTFSYRFCHFLMFQKILVKLGRAIHISFISNPDFGFRVKVANDFQNFSLKVSYESKILDVTPILYLKYLKVKSRY